MKNLKLISLAIVVIAMIILLACNEENTVNTITSEKIIPTQPCTNPISWLGASHNSGVDYIYSSSTFNVSGITLSDDNFNDYVIELSYDYVQSDALLQDPNYSLQDHDDLVRPFLEEMTSIEGYRNYCSTQFSTAANSLSSIQVSYINQMFNLVDEGSTMTVADIQAELDDIESEMCNDNMNTTSNFAWACYTVFKSSFDRAVNLTNSNRKENKDLSLQKWGWVEWTTVAVDYCTAAGCAASAVQTGGVSLVVIGKATAAASGTANLVANLIDKAIEE